MSFDKFRVQRAFEVLSENRKYKDTLADAAYLLAVIVDSGANEPTQLKRVTAKIASNVLRAPYEITIQELEKKW